MLPEISDLLIYVICYFLGSIPSGFLVGLLMGNEDIRKKGSGSTGATNLTRIYGKRAGIVTFIADCIKALVAIRLVGVSGESVYIAAFLVTVGHIFPVWLGFKGGKGVATLATAVFYLNPYLGMIFALLWVGVFFVYKTSSLSSIFAILGSLIISIFFKPTDHFTYFLLITSILVLFAHRANIKKLIKGEEHSFKE
jgi:glycerol-3-phosphate acyltransferase PlsY